MTSIKNCPNKENIDRINYLYQIANVVGHNDCSNIASRKYTSLMLAIAKKTVQRLDIDIKRRICKGCHFLLLPGINCNVRLKKKKLRWTCLTCQRVKTFDVGNRKYKVWTEKPESVVEYLDYENNTVKTE